MLGGAAGKGLEKKQQCHHKEKPCAGPLCRRQWDFTRRTERNRILLASMPAKEIPSAKGRQEEANAAQKSDQGEHTPNDGIRRGMVIYQRLGRPVVGVGICKSRPARRAGPRGPTEESRELVNLRGISYGFRAETKPGARLAEEFAIIVREIVERLGLRGAKSER